MDVGFKAKCQHYGLDVLLCRCTTMHDCSYILQSIKCGMPTLYDQASLAGKETRFAGSETAIGALGAVPDAGGDTTEGARDTKWRLWTSAVS